MTKWENDAFSVWHAVMIIGQQCMVQPAGLDLIGREHNLALTAWQNMFQQEYLRGKEHYNDLK